LQIQFLSGKLAETTPAPAGAGKNIRSAAGDWNINDGIEYSL